MDYLTLIVAVVVIIVVIFAVLGFQKTVGDIGNVFKGMGEGFGNLFKGFQFPEFKFPEIVMPEFTFPKFTMPEFTMPEIGLDEPINLDQLFLDWLAGLSPSGNGNGISPPPSTDTGMAKGTLYVPSARELQEKPVGVPSLANPWGFISTKELIAWHRRTDEEKLMVMPPDEVLYQLVPSDLTDVEVRQRMSEMSGFRGKQFMR